MTGANYIEVSTGGFEWEAGERHEVRFPVELFVRCTPIRTTVGFRHVRRDSRGKRHQPNLEGEAVLQFGDGERMAEPLILDRNEYWFPAVENVLNILLSKTQLLVKLPKLEKAPYDSRDILELLTDGFYYEISGILPVTYEFSLEGSAVIRDECADYWSPDDSEAADEDRFAT